MNIVCVSASRIPSVTANSIQVMKACQALAQIGHQVHLLAPVVPARGMGERPARSAWAELAAHYGLKTPFDVSWLPAQPRWRRYDFALSAVKEARRLGADLLYVWPLQAALAGALAGLPVVIEMHGPAEGRLGPLLLRSFLRLPAKGSFRRLLPITQALAAMLERQAGRKFQQGECVIAPNGVDLERFQDLPEPAAARSLLGLPQGSAAARGLTVGYTGHLYPGRGMAMLEHLAQRLPDLQFVWVGGQPEDVQAWRSRLAAQGVVNVNLIGFVENQRLPLYQAAVEILLMPYERSIAGSSGGNSAAYASPMKMFEYMACRRAIISSDLPVIREVLHSENAVLCPPEDALAWEQALSALAQDSDRRQALAGRAWQDVQTYTWVQRARKALEGLDG